MSIAIRSFRSGDEAAFCSMNLAWIERHFAVEPKDRQVLEHPQAAILDQGGAILMAVAVAPGAEETALGCVALIKMDQDCFELAKMCVALEAQGRGVGRRLLAAALAEAGRRGARRVYLETNSGLGPALKLYRDAGFEPLAVKRPTPYARADVQMELYLAPSP